MLNGGFYLVRRWSYFSIKCPFAIKWSLLINSLFVQPQLIMSCSNIYIIWVGLKVQYIFMLYHHWLPLFELPKTESPWSSPNLLSGYQEENEKLFQWGGNGHLPAVWFRNSDFSYFWSGQTDTMNVGCEKSPTLMDLIAVIFVLNL